MTNWRGRFPFEFVLMTGDNLYGSERPRDYEKKFSAPYKPLIDAGVKFYASLGNHDDGAQIQYKLFNMEGKKYYSFKPKDGVRFFAIDSNYVDDKQLDWLGKELAASGSDWKIAFFHHPLYSSGATHGSADAQRELLEPMFLKHSVDVVISGHEHFYERLKPQKGVAYFILGSSSKLRKGDLRKSAMTAYGNDSAYAFMLVEIDGDTMHFQTDQRQGRDARRGKRPPRRSYGKQIAAEAAASGSSSPRSRRWINSSTLRCPLPRCCRRRTYSGSTPWSRIRISVSSGMAL